MKPNSNNDALYSSIYRIIGIAYDWDTNKLAELYEVPVGQFELWLEQLGFSYRQIAKLRDRKSFGNKFCTYCGIKTKEVFCSDECKEKYIKRKAELQRILITNKIQLTKDSYYNIISGKIE